MGNEGREGIIQGTVDSLQMGFAVFTEEIKRSATFKPQWNAVTAYDGLQKWDVRIVADRLEYPGYFQLIFCCFSRKRVFQDGFAVEQMKFSTGRDGQMSGLFIWNPEHLDELFRILLLLEESDHQNAEIDHVDLPGAAMV